MSGQQGVTPPSKLAVDDVPVGCCVGDHGYAGVPEFASKELVAEKGDVQENFGETTDLKYADKLALILMLAAKPNFNHASALEKMLGRHVLENKRGIPI